MQPAAPILPLHFITDSFKDGIPRRSCVRGKEVEESGTKAWRGSRAVEGRHTLHQQEDCHCAHQCGDPPAHPRLKAEKNVPAQFV
jgi:hypothetical protein